MEKWRHVENISRPCYFSGQNFQSTDRIGLRIPKEGQADPLTGTALVSWVMSSCRGGWSGSHMKVSAGPLRWCCIPSRPHCASTSSMPGAPDKDTCRTKPLGDTPNGKSTCKKPLPAQTLLTHQDPKQVGKETAVKWSETGVSCLGHAVQYHRGGHHIQWTRNEWMHDFFHCWEFLLWKSPVHSKQKGKSLKKILIKGFLDTRST